MPIFDIQLVARANELCNEAAWTSSRPRYGRLRDGMREHGLLGPAELGDLDLRFGNGEALLQAIPLDHRAARRRRAPRTRLAADGRPDGGGSEAWAMQVKGLELAMHERAARWAWPGLRHDEAGADHLVASTIRSSST